MSCSYKIGKLKNFIYLVKDLVYLTANYKVNIVKGTVYKLNADLITLSEQEDYSGRFKFTTTVNCTLNRIFDDSELKLHKFKIVVEDLKGMLFLVSPEFDAKYTSEINVAEDELSYKLIFTTLSNIPTRIVQTKITPSNVAYLKPCQYDLFGVSKLFIKGLNDWEKVDYLKCTYNKTFDGRQSNINVQFTIPIEDNDWHYDLIKFPNNRWDIKMTINGTDVIESNLFPQYTRLTQEDLGTADIFTITLKGVQGGSLIGQSSQQEQVRWIQVEGFICDKFNKYQKENKLINVDGIWTSTTEYRKGILLEKNSIDCGYTPGIKYKWETQDIKVDYTCVGVNKHFQELQYKSTDDGKTWTPTGESRAGGLAEANSEDCGYVNVRWVPVEGEYICEEYDPSISWVLTDDYYCTPINL